MTSTQLYLATLLPQWGIFTGIVLIIVGYVDKKNLWTRLGWIVLIATGLTAFYFNLFGGLKALAETNGSPSQASLLLSTGWQTTVGGILAIASLLMFQFKIKRYALLAVLTILYFSLTFFLYLQVSGSPKLKIKTEAPMEQKN